MSQAENNSAFARVPFNFHTQKAEEFRNSMKQENNQPVNSDANQPVPPQGQPVQATQPVNPVQPEPAPVSALVQQAVPPYPMPPLQYPQPPQQQQVVDASVAQRLEDERNAAYQEIQQLRQAVANLSTEQYHNQRENAVNNALSQELLESLGTIDADDARKLAGAMYDSMSAPMEQMRGELQQQRKMLDQQAQKAQQDAAYQNIARLNSEVMRYHPDFAQVVNMPEFRDFLMQRDGYSYETRDQRAAREYQNGNPAYIIDLLYQFKGTRPDVQKAMTVAPSNAPSHVQAPTSQDSGTPQYTLRELNDLFGMRRISHEQYKAELAKLKPAIAAQYYQQ